MGKDTNIAWCHHTFNSWWLCTEVDEACDNCYARELAKRWGHKWGAGVPRLTFGDKHWNEPRKWNAEAEREGKPHRVFCASMADVFDDEAPAGELERLWNLIRETPWLHWQLLTKRAHRIKERLPADWGSGYKNVWLGVTVGNTKGLWRARHLVEIPAVVHFVSYEPALEYVDFSEYLSRGHGVQWLIAGAESGRRARPMDEAWVRSVRDQCAAAGTTFFLKQFADDRGRKLSLPVLDGRQHAEFPA